MILWACPVYAVLYGAVTSWINQVYPVATLQNIKFSNFYGKQKTIVQIIVKYNELQLKFPVLNIRKLKTCSKACSLILKETGRYH